MALRRPPTTFSDSIDAADLAANSVTASELADDAVDTAALADGAVDADRLAANAVTTVKVADDAVTYAKLQNLATGNRVLGATGAGVIGEVQVATDMVVDSAVTVGKVAADVIGVTPHIILGKLYPAFNGKIAGGASHSGDYGTAQADGLSYYYTSIQHSKPIKDPRIGAHYGSQRFPIKSVQNISSSDSPGHFQSSSKVHTVDGREWFRGVGSFGFQNAGEGIQFEMNTYDTYFEIVGYFTDANIQAFNYSSVRHFTWSVDGGSETTDGAFRTAYNVSPIGNSRYVDGAGWHNIGLGDTIGLGIHTLKIMNKTTGGSTASQGFRPYAIELVTQDKHSDATCDTTNTDATITMDSTTKIKAGMLVTGTGIPAAATVLSVTNATTFELSANATATNANTTLVFNAPNDVQIHAQNVVSHGKRMSVSATGLHYNPFAFKTDGTTAWASGAHNGTSWPVGTGLSHNIDTATSLGLSKWLHSSNYYKPYQGGRVVIWVDSSGNIKTSVTVMPPNAKSFGDADISKKANASVTDTSAFPTFEANTGGARDVGEDCLDEIAKIYRVTEFGNGSANSGFAGTWQDFSYVKQNANYNYAFCLDDGMTSLHGRIRGGLSGIYPDDATDYYSFNFIGTGLAVSGGIDGQNDGSMEKFRSKNHFQNIPYGHHVVSYTRDATTANSPWVVDGTQYMQDWGSNADAAGHAKEFQIHQPKRPPIPETAVVLADYMLMADFTPQSAQSAKNNSKGVRTTQCSRDIFYQGTNFSLDMADDVPGGIRMHSTNNSLQGTIPSFCKNFVVSGLQSENYHNIYLDGVNKDSVAIKNNDSGYGSVSYLPTAQEPTLGVHLIGHQQASGTNGNFSFYQAVIPIHTSSHYQTFETQLEDYLVGGDRNMEQTNLVVTPDGKTWDELRDTSYIGKTVLQASGTNPNINGSASQWAEFIRLDTFRGVDENRHQPCFVKSDFVVEYDITNARQNFVCLKNGRYIIKALVKGTGDGVIFRFEPNYAASFNLKWGSSGATNETKMISTAIEFVRGDFFTLRGSWGTDDDYDRLWIERA